MTVQLQFFFFFFLVAWCQENGDKMLNITDYDRMFRCLNTVCSWVKNKIKKKNQMHDIATPST